MRNAVMAAASLAVLVACTEQARRTAPPESTKSPTQAASPTPYAVISAQELVRPADATAVSPGIFKKVIKPSNSRVPVENAKILGFATEAYTPDGSASATGLHFEPWSKLSPAWQAILRDSFEGEVSRVWYCDSAGSASSCTVVDFMIFGDVEKPLRNHT